MEKIFISYGHDEHVKLVRKFKEDLELNGFKVWIDEENINSGSDFDFEIEKGIKNSTWVIFFMTTHALRRPGGVCLDELAFAKKFEKSLLPILVQNVEPPLFLTRIQYIEFQKYFNEDGTINIEYYEERLQKILRLLKGEEKILVDGEINQLINYLSPLNNDVYIYEYIKNYYGRNWFVEKYEKWLNSEEGRVLVITGSAGSGKTSIIAQLCHSREEIQAVHFCKYNDNERANPKSVIMSLAFHLATQIEEYRDILFTLNDIDNLREKSIRRLFSYLITEPLYSIKNRNKKTVIIIDALDEADFYYRNELVDIIASEFQKTPKWLKLVVSTRPEKEIMRKLRTHEMITLDSYKEETKTDIIGYISKELKEELEEICDPTLLLEKIYQLSEGNFLYANQFVNSVKQKYFSLDNVEHFPVGLMNVYNKYFDRIFADKELDYKKDYRRLFELIAGSLEPLSVSEVLAILEIDEYELDEILDSIHVLFPVVAGIIQPMHKSLIDWLINKEMSGSYRVSLKKANQTLGMYYYNKCLEKANSNYAYKYAIRHLLIAEECSLAKALMSDFQVLSKRITIEGLDTFSRKYFDELELLNELNLSLAKDLMISEGFLKLLLKNRKYYYNSGLYFTLQKIGFGTYIQECIDEYGYKGKLLYSNFLYITESFSEAIKISELLLEDHEKLSIEELGEIYSICSMSFRKLVDFDKSNYFTAKCLSLGNEKDAEYEKSLSNLMKGKIAFHRLNWEESYNEINKSISILKSYLNRNISDDDRINIELFIAEYLRVLADAAIWNSDYDYGQKQLELAEEIYTRLKVADRYYIRYLYTISFHKIGKGKFEEALNELVSLFDKVASYYDKFQILLYQALAYAGIGNLEKAQITCKKALENTKVINAWIETEEVNSLLEVITGEGFERTNDYVINKDIQIWSAYAKKYFQRIVKKI